LEPASCANATDASDLHKKKHESDITSTDVWIWIDASAVLANPLFSILFNTELGFIAINASDSHKKAFSTKDFDRCRNLNRRQPCLANVSRSIRDRVIRLGLVSAKPA
jgi:hypothetical protein